MVAETNQAYEASGVNHRVVLAGRSEVPYSETGDSDLDLDRLRDRSDGHLDGVPTLRERVGADLVHLIVGEADDICGLAYVPGVFGLTLQGCGGRTFAHELGHSMGLRHDRYAQLYSSSEVGRRPVTLDPAFGYVNQRTFESGALPSSRWRSIMAYNAQCDDAGFYCSRVLAFSSPRLHIDGDPLGVAYRAGGTGRDRPGRRRSGPQHYGSRRGIVAGSDTRPRQPTADGRGKPAGPEPDSRQRAGRGCVGAVRRSRR